MVYYEKCNRVVNMKCERMRASTMPCRFWHRCGRRFGRPPFGIWFAFWVRYSVATVLRDQRCNRFPLAGLSRKSPPASFPFSVGASFARRVMGRVRDSSVTRDASFCALVWRRLRRSPDVEAASAGRGPRGGGGAAQARASPGGMPCSGCARCCSFGGGWRARARWLAHGAGVAGGWFARCGCRVTAALAATRERRLLAFA